MAEDLAEKQAEMIRYLTERNKQLSRRVNYLSTNSPASDS